MDFPHLFTPGQIGSCRLKNRIIMPLYPTKYATDGKVNDRIIEFYRARANGGAGMIVLDCPCLDYPRAYKGPHILRFDSDKYTTGLKNLLDVIHAGGCKAFMHLSYPRERKSGEGGDSKIALVNSMTLAEADEILEMMVAGAGKAKEIGYDGVEIQASYGDLVAQLLSPLSNKRQDDLGGSLENRSRFLIRLIDGVRSEVGEGFPVMVKLVCEEYDKAGFSIEDAVATARSIESAGADAVVASAGNKKTRWRTIPTSESIPGPLVPLAAKLKTVISIPIIAIGKINEPKLAEEILEHNKADFVAMARGLVADPDLPHKAASGVAEKIRRCLYCLEDCADKGVPGIGRCCTVNPFSGNESIWKIEPSGAEKNVLVIGGGPAGIQAALIASKRGHRVELWEQCEQLGGQLKIAHLAPFKENILRFLRHQEQSLKESNVSVKLGYTARVETILEHHPDIVILATGSRSYQPDLPGKNSENVVDARELYDKPMETGRNIVVLGGGEIGCETAEWVHGPGKKITIVEIASEILNNMKKIPRERLLYRLKQKDISILTETRIRAIETDRVLLRKTDKDEYWLPADQIIVSIGSKPEYSLYSGLKDDVDTVLIIGDAHSPGNLGTALRAATETALNL